MSTSSQFFSFESLREELSVVIQNEASIVSFCKLLEDIRNFALKEVESRNKILTDIAYWKGEFEYRRKLSEVTLRKKDAVMYNKSLEKIRLTGVKYTEQMISSNKDAQMDEAYENLLKSSITYGKWSSILNDCYFALNSTHKLMGVGA